MVPQKTTRSEPSWTHLLSQAEPSSVHIHLVGIGGAGLSAIARVLLGRGFRVSGSDRQRSSHTDELELLGATLFLGHDPSHGADADLVLVSSAIPGDNPEIATAHAAGVPVVKRSQFLDPLMAGYTSLCVAGTHGKTTTTAMLATILDQAGAEPSFILGSQVLALGTNARAGRPGGPFVVEADEYDHMFLGLRPDLAVITNVEWDHVDCYPKPEHYRRAFVQFAASVRPGGCIIACADDAGANWVKQQVKQTDVRWVSYGLQPGSHWRAAALRTNAQGGTDFEIWQQEELQGYRSLLLAGPHNVLNALAAVAAAAEIGYNVFCKPYKNLKIWQKLLGTARRLERKGESCDIIVFDDYAHHPTEVRAVLSAARQRFPRRALWVLFQPHTYSRTRALLNEFCESFENADHVLITDIYAAREHDTLGVSAQDLVSGMSSHPDARYAGDLDSAVRLLLSELEAGDVLLTLGAGDGYVVGEQVLAALQAREPVRSGRRQAGDYRVLASAISRDTGLAVRHDEPLANHTTMRVGGPADLFVAVSSLDDLQLVVNLARELVVPVLVLGGGSNLLVSDHGVRGLVVANGCRTVRRHEGDVVWAESGANLAGLARQTVRWGLTGLEWGVSVPGTVGGAVVGNAGAHGGAVADNLLRTTLQLADGRLAEWPAARLQYRYRMSTLKSLIRAGEPYPLVLTAAFQLAPGNRAQIEQRATEFLSYRRASQPVEASAGSVFQNPPGDFAGRILDSLGFKGRGRGGAAYSTVHANFIVNSGGARASDVVALIDEARQAAWQAHAIELVPEILFVGDWPQQPPYRQLAK